MLEARIEMRLETESADDRIVVAVDVRIDTIKALEDLADEGHKGLGERSACRLLSHCSAPLGVQRGMTYQCEKGRPSRYQHWPESRT